MLIRNASDSCLTWQEFSIFRIPPWDHVTFGMVTPIDTVLVPKESTSLENSKNNNKKVELHMKQTKLWVNKLVKGGCGLNMYIFVSFLLTCQMRREKVHSMRRAECSHVRFNIYDSILRHYCCCYYYY